MGYYKQSRLSNGEPKRNDKSKGRTGGADYTPIRWVTWQFSPEDKRRISESEFDVEKFFDTLAGLVSEGHKFTVSPKNSNGFVSASLFGHGDECPNKGFGVSGEGGTAYSACKSLYWKLEFLQYDLRLPEINSEDDFR